MPELPPPLDLLPYLLDGLVSTARISACAAALALACASIAAWSRVHGDRLSAAIALGYVEVFRGTSLLVLLFWGYFALPAMLGFRPRAESVAIVVLGLHIGAYGAEVVRGALEAVPRSQVEAAHAVHLRPTQQLRHVILPQALPRAIPPLGNLMIELVKGSALTSLITVTDLTRAGLDLRDDSLRTTEVFLTLLALYFLLSSAIAWATRAVERKVALPNAEPPDRAARPRGGPLTGAGH